MPRPLEASVETGARRLARQLKPGNRQQILDNARRFGFKYVNRPKKFEKPGVSRDFEPGRCR